MEIPGLGLVVEDADFEVYRSTAVPVPVLGGSECEFVVQGYEDHPDPEAYHEVIQTFLALGPSALTDAAPAVYDYYLRTRELLGDELDVEIAGPQDVFQYVDLGDEPEVLCDETGRVFVSLECNCDWEPEHGLQLVFRDGAAITKVGPYDGQLV